jgi:hypothetical protein
MEYNSNYWVYLHGLFMALAWCVFIPIGIVMARHKWIFYDKTFLGLHVWFHLHRIIQMTGIGLFVASFVIAFVQMGIPDKGIGFAHYILGICIMAMVVGQLMTTFIRPLPSSTHRYVWNFVHRTWGQLTLFTSWANIFIGIYIFHIQEGEPYLRWLIPMCAVMMLISTTDLVLFIVKKLHCSQDTNTSQV